MTNRELKRLAINLDAVWYSQITIKPKKDDVRHVDISWKDSDGRGFKKDQPYQYTRIIAHSEGTNGCNGVLYQLFPSNVFVYADKPCVAL